MAYSFLSQHRFKVSAGILLSVALAAVASAARAPQKPPFVLPFDPGVAGTMVATEFRVTKPLLYSVQLQYDFREGDQADRARAWRLAGGRQTQGPGMSKEPGAQLALRVVVSSSTAGSNPLVNEIVRNPRLTSWGASALKAELIAFKLDPGMYKVSVESLQAAPEFHNEPVGVLVVRPYRGK